MQRIIPAAEFVRRAYEGMAFDLIDTRFASQHTVMGISEQDELYATVGPKELEALSDQKIRELNKKYHLALVGVEGAYGRLQKALGGQ